MRIIDHFDNAVRYYPHNVAFVEVGNDSSQLTYAQAAPRTHAIAGALHHHGYGEGHHVGILSPNSIAAFLALLGVYRARAVWLPINSRNSVALNAELLNDFDGELLLFHSTYASEAMQLMDACPLIREIVCIDGDCGVGIALEKWAQGVPQTFNPNLDANLDAIFGIFPTGGTTGKSKGVMITHRNIHTMLGNIYAHLTYHDNTCHLVVAPMTHTSGLTGCMHFARGGCNAIMAVVHPAAIAEAIERYKVTHLFLPPTVLYMMLALPDIRSWNYSSLQHFMVAAAPTSFEKLKEAIDVFGPVMTEGLGQTEAPASITMKAPCDYLNPDGSINEARLRSVGRPCVFNTTVAILDDGGNELPRGQAGEICVRGDIVTLGYYKNPQATAEVRRYGWHHTGDVGIMADDGYITIVDRKKDMIITGGFNVFPNEIEQVLMTHASVQDCAVIGVPDEKWGEAVKAIVQLKTNHDCSADELIALVKERLGGVMAPKSVDFIAQLPRSSVGKVLKAELRKAFWKEKSRAVN